MDTSPQNESIHDWLKGFSRAVRARDYESGRRLFAEEVVGFGSVAERYDGLQNLEVLQWRKVWDATTGFEFDLDTTAVSVEGNMAWAASSWQSFGTTATGESFLRRGRSTFVYRRINEQWLAVHSHFSLEPRP